jgi:hypothetical protein
LPSIIKFIEGEFTEGEVHEGAREMSEQQDKDWFKEYVEKEMTRLSTAIDTIRSELAHLALKVGATADLAEDLRTIETDLKAVSKQAHNQKNHEADLTPVWTKINRNAENIAALKAKAVMFSLIAAASFNIIMALFGLLKK